MDEIVETPDMPVTLMVDGQECELHALSIGDRFAIAARMRDEKLNAYLALIENKPLRMEVVSDSIAKIMTAPITTVEILTTPAGDVFSVLYSLRRGNPKIRLESVLKIPPMRLKLFLAVIRQMSNKEAEAGEAENPTASISGS